MLNSTGKWLQLWNNGTSKQHNSSLICSSKQTETSQTEKYKYDGEILLLSQNNCSFPINPNLLMPKNCFWLTFLKFSRKIIYLNKNQRQHYSKFLPKRHQMSINFSKKLWLQDNQLGLKKCKPMCKQGKKSGTNSQLWINLYNEQI